MTIYLHCRGSIFNSSKLPVPWKPCGLYRGGDLCWSHRAEDGRYVSFCSSQHVSFWQYVGFYFVDNMWVFSGIILFMIFEYGSIIKLGVIELCEYCNKNKFVCVVIKFCWKALLCHFTNIIPFSQQHIYLLFSSNDARTIWRIHIVKSI